jgi:hypothetical protein
MVDKVPGDETQRPWFEDVVGIEIAENVASRTLQTLIDRVALATIRFARPGNSVAIAA